VPLIRVFVNILFSLGSHAAEAIKSIEVVLYLEIKDGPSNLQMILYLWMYFSRPADEL
tara:strand:- start:400 stop:573 length:174 start_codon:yes stop_codon:yes gene_type:complete